MLKCKLKAFVSLISIQPFFVPNKSVTCSYYWDIDNKTTPTIFPFLTYDTGKDKYKNIEYSNSYQLYNIFREKNTAAHAQKQIKVSHFITANKEIYYAKSKINFETQIHNQYFDTENKKIGTEDVSSNYYRFFPMTGITIDTPIKHIRSEILINPKLTAIINSPQSNSNRISNEVSTNNNVFRH